MNHLEKTSRESRSFSSSASLPTSSSSSSSEEIPAVGKAPKHRKSKRMLRRHVKNVIASFLSPSASIHADRRLCFWSPSATSVPALPNRAPWTSPTAADSCDLYW